MTFRNFVIVILLIQAAPVFSSISYSAPAQKEVYEVTAESMKGTGGDSGDILNLSKVKIVHGNTILTGDNGIYYRKEEIVNFKGNVRIVDGTTIITAPEATYYKQSEIAALQGGVKTVDKDAVFYGDRGNYFKREEKAVLFGNARLDEKGRWLTAQSITYDRGRNRVLAEGKVRGYDADNRSWIEAGVIDYDREKKMAVATQDPVVTSERQSGKGNDAGTDTTGVKKNELKDIPVQSSGPDTSGGAGAEAKNDSGPMIITGQKMTFYTDEKRAISEGNVTITRGKTRATCDKATMLDKENKVILEGGPVAWDENGKVKGDTIEILFNREKLDKVNVWGHANILYVSTDKDRTGESSKLSGRSATINMENEEPREVVAEGKAESEYIPPPSESGKGERNKVKGEKVSVFFKDRRATTATVEGNGAGMYSFNSEKDAAGESDTTANSETATYSGQTIEFDVPNDNILISGHASLLFRNQKLEAENVEFNSKTRTLTAYGEPALWDGDQKMTGDWLVYNIDTKKGTIRSGRTTFEQGYYTGKKIKKVREDVLDVKDASYTTCELDHPHFRFSAPRMKVYVDDKVVAKPIVLYISEIPIIGLPFYVFPIKKGRHSGFMIPQFEFGLNANAGRFLRNAGYYWAVNDYSDVSVWGDYYEGTRWTTYFEGRYNSRYLLSGNLNMSYSKDVVTGARRWDLTENHRQTLGDRFNLTMRGNFVSDKTYRQRAGNGNSLQERLNTLLRSDASLSKSWSRTSLNLTVARSQDLSAGTVTQSFPTASFYFSQRAIGRQKTKVSGAFLPWLSNTYYGFNLGMNNRTDKNPYTKTATSQVSGNFSLSDSRRFLGWLDFSPSLSAAQDVSLRDPTGRRYGRSVSLSANSGVTLYGVTSPKLGPLVALRHIITPQVSYSQSRQQTVYKSARYSGTGRFLSYSVQNRFQAKVKSGDTVKRLDNIAILTFSRGIDLTKPVDAPYFPTNSALQIRPIGPFYLDFSATHDPVKKRTQSVNGTGSVNFSGSIGKKTGTGEEVTEAMPFSSSTTLRFSKIVGLPVTSFWVDQRIDASPTKKWKMDYYIHYDINTKEIASQGLELHRDLHCWEARFVRRYYGKNWEYYFRISVKALSEIYFERGTSGLGGY